MSAEFDPKLEPLIDAALKELPPLSAPGTLVPGVMAILKTRLQRQPWWRQVWWDWPLPAKAAFLLLALALFGGFGRGGLILDYGVTSYSQQLFERLAPVTNLGDTLLTLFSAAGLLGQKAADLLLVYVLILAGALYLTCLLLGTACVRYALKRA
jgi:hypothetical protein